MNRPGRLGLVVGAWALICLCSTMLPQATAQQRVRTRAAQQRIRSNSQVLERRNDSAQVRSVGTLILFEGESLAEGARASEGRVVRQSMTGFRGSWSGDAQLLWTPSQSGARLEVTVRVNRAGDYGLSGFFTKAPDYGRFKVGAHGREVGAFDGFAPQVQRSSRVSLGRVALQAGENQVIFVIDGKARESTGYYVGIDRLELLAAAGGDGKIRSVVPRRPQTPRPRPEAPAARPEAGAPTASELQRSVEVLNGELGRLGSAGEGWRRYLQLEELEWLAGSPQSESDGASRERLRAILARFDATGRNPEYAAVADLAGFRRVRAALRRQAARGGSDANRLRVDTESPAVRRPLDGAARRQDLPDLRIVSGRWIRDTWIEFEVANFGKTASQGALVAASSDLSPAARQMAVPGLEPGQTRAFRLELPEDSTRHRPDGDYTGTVVTLEVEHSAAERSRANNRFIFVLGGSDEEVVRLELSTLQAGVAALEQDLDRLGGGAGWKEFFGTSELRRLTAEPLEQLDTSERRRLQAIAARFEQIGRDAKYQSIARLPGFEEAHGATHALASRLADVQVDAVSGQPRADSGRGFETRFDFSIPLSNFARRPTAELPKGALLFRRSGEFQLTQHVEVSPQAADQSVYFSWDVSKVPGAGGVLWQVSRVNFLPLTGGEADRAPHGLVRSGTAQGRGGGFTVDFATLGSAAPAAQPPAQEPNENIAQQADTEPGSGGARQRLAGRLHFVLNLDQINAFANAGGAVSYYVRVIPVAARGSGAIVGQPSNVMRVFHGKMPQRNDFRFHEKGLNPQPQPQAPRDIHVTRFHYLPAKTECRAHTDKSNCGKYKGRGGNKKPWEKIADFVSDAWDWASGAYQTIKDKVVETVATGLNVVLPVHVPESVIAMALDSALVSAGIPPSIPNFDELMEENLDYMAELAVEEMNLPPGASGLAKEKVKEGIRAGARAARDAANGAGPGTPCDEWTAPPYFLVGLENRGNKEYRDLRVDIAHGLFDRREKTVPFLRPGQAVTIPVVLPRGQRREFWDGQLYDEGAWWQAYHETAYDCHVFIVTRNSPDFPKGYPRSLATHVEPERVWNTALERNIQ